MPRGKAKSDDEILIEKEAELEKLKIEITQLKERVRQINLQKIADAIQSSGRTIEDVLSDLAQNK